MNNLPETDINRFIEAQDSLYYGSYQQALEEIRNGKKTSHWIWYIFPQLRCLGRSRRAHYYGIADKKETIDRIAVCSIDFAVHSASELDSAIKSISGIKGVDEVHRVDIE